MRTTLTAVLLLLLVSVVVAEDIAALEISEPEGTEAPAEAQTEAAAETTTPDANVIRLKLVPGNGMKQSPISLSQVLPDGRHVVVNPNSADGMPAPQEQVLESVPADDVVDEEMGTPVRSVVIRDKDGVKKEVLVAGPSGIDRTGGMPVPPAGMPNFATVMQNFLAGMVNPQDFINAVAQGFGVPANGSEIVVKHVESNKKMAVWLLVLIILVVVVGIVLLVLLVVFIVKKKKAAAKLTVVPGPNGPVLAAAPTDSASAQSADPAANQPPV